MPVIEVTDIEPKGSTDPVEVLAATAMLPKGRIKDAMTKGAVWLTRNGRQRRLRRAKSALRQDDRLAIYYDDTILGTTAPVPDLVEDHGDFSVWHKPAGLLCGGTRFGDHCAIDRVVERKLDRPTFLVHRLDRFVSGIMLLAHTKRSAAALSQQFQSRETSKVYEATVHGRLEDECEVTTPVDGKNARSIVTPLQPGQDTSVVQVRIETGRKHQIRRHLQSIGHPIVGDRQYGSSSAEELQLRSVHLGFNHPTTGVRLNFQLPGYPAK